MSFILRPLPLLLALAASASAAKLPADKDDLRKLVSLPPMNFTLTLTPVRGRLRWQQDLAAPEPIARLQKELRGDSSDAPRLLQLANLLDDASRTNQAASTFSNAVTAFRQQLQTRPNDPRLLSGLGEALANTDQPVEAEALLRRAVTLAPQDPASRTQLGLFLSARSRAALYPAAPPPELLQSPALLATKYRPSPDQFERAEKLSRESLDCFDRAIALATNDPAAFERRACALLPAAFLRALKDQTTNPDPNRLLLALSPFNPDCLPDLHRAAQLAPDDPSLQAAVAFAEAMGAVMSQALLQHRPDQPHDHPWDALTPDQAGSVQQRIRRLAALADNPAPDIAAPAAMFLGLLQSVLLEDQSAAVANLRRAVTLNPKLQPAWEALIATLGQDDRFEQMLQAAESQLRAIDSPRTHLCLAKAHEKLNHWDKVLEQSQLALRESPNDLTAKLAVASAALRLNLKNLRQASSILFEPGAGDFSQADPPLRAHALFLCALTLALDDQPDHARPLLQQVLRLQPSHDDAKKALAIIESWK